MLGHLEQVLVSSRPNIDTKNAADLKVLARLSMECRYALYQSIFADLTTEHAKLLISSTDGTPSAEFSDKFSSGLIYGEVNYSSFVHVLQRCSPAAGEVFVDLGHGTGKALIAAAVCYGEILSRIHGVEILAPLHAESLKRIAAYGAAVASEANHELFRDHSNCSITAVEGDFLAQVEEGEFDWTAADMVFVNSTCFDSALMMKIARRAERMRCGARIATLTYALPSDQFEVTWKENLCMSWGIATAFVHVRK